MFDLQQQLSNIFRAGGFSLRKWSSNEDVLLRDVPAEHRVQRELRAWQPQETHSMLGLLWHPGTNDFSFAVRRVPLPTVTRRSVLALTARLFDPLGWLVPVVVRAKVAFQTTWLQSRGWDDPLDDAVALQWRRYHEELPFLECTSAAEDLP